MKEKYSGSKFSLLPVLASFSLLPWAGLGVPEGQYFKVHSVLNRSVTRVAMCFLYVAKKQAQGREQTCRL